MTDADRALLDAMAAFLHAWGFSDTGKGIMFTRGEATTESIIKAVADYRDSRGAP